MMKYISAAVSADQHIFSASTFLCRDWQWCVYAQSAKIGLTNGHGSFGRWLYLRNRLVSRFLPVISWLGSEDPPRSLKLASSALSNTSVGYRWGGAVPWETWAKSLSRFSFATATSTPDAGGNGEPSTTTSHDQLSTKFTKLHGKRLIERRLFFQPWQVHFPCVFSGISAAICVRPFFGLSQILRQTTSFYQCCICKCVSLSITSVAA